MAAPAAALPLPCRTAAIVKNRATAIVTQEERPSTPSVKFVPFTVATAMKTSAGNERMPRFNTRPFANGTFMSREISLCIVRIRPKITAMMIWKSIFCFTVRPSERFFFTLMKSSVKPTMPKPRVRKRIGRHSGLLPTKTRHATVKPRRIMRPPMFGVPVFERWDFGPSSRSVCSALRRMRAGIRKWPEMALTKKARSIGTTTETKSIFSTIIIFPIWPSAGLLQV